MRSSGEKEGKLGEMGIYCMLCAGADEDRHGYILQLIEFMNTVAKISVSGGRMS